MSNSTVSQSIFVLQNEVPFEGSNLVGVFSSPEAADTYFQGPYKAAYIVYPDDTYVLYETVMNPDSRTTYKVVKNLY